MKFGRSASRSRARTASESPRGRRRPGPPPLFPRVNPKKTADDAGLVRHEEELVEAGGAARGIGHLRARKRVATYQIDTDVPVEFEELSSERVAVEADDSGEIETLPDGAISIPVFEEELVVEKRVVLRERIILRKELATDVRRIETELRREVVELDADPGIEIVGDEGT